MYSRPRDARPARWTASVTFPGQPAWNASTDDARLSTIAEEIVLSEGVPEEAKASAVACLDICLDMIHARHGIAADGAGVGGNGVPPATRMTKRVVDLAMYHEVAKKKDMRAKAALAEYRLSRNYATYQVTAPAFVNLQRLQDEQGRQMAFLIESSGGKADVETLVETHAQNLAIAQNASEIGLKQLAHQQRHLYAQTLAAVAIKNDDACPVIPLLKEPEGGIPAGVGDPSRGGGVAARRGGAAASGSAAADAAGGVSSSLLDAPAAGLRTGQRAVGAALGKVRGALWWGGDTADGGGSSSALDEAAAATTTAAPGNGTPAIAARGRSTPVAAGGSFAEDTPPPTSTDITADSSSMLYLTVPSTTGVEGIRGMSVDMPVRVLNIKSTVNSYLTYGGAPGELQITERAATMKRIILDDIGAFIVPVSMHDIEGAGAERAVRGRDAATEYAKDICMALPQHIVESCDASAELVFSGLQDGIAEALALHHDSIAPGMAIATQHTNMPWCQLLILAVYHPRQEATLHASMAKAVLLSQGASQLFLDMSKVSDPALVRGIFSTALREKARSIFSGAPGALQTYPLHTPSALRDRDIPPLSIVLSASQLVLSRDLHAGPFSGYNPRYQTPGGSPTGGSPTVSRGATPTSTR